MTDPNAATFTGYEEIDLILEKPHSRIWLHALGPVVSSIKAVLPDGMEIGATFTGDQTPDGVARIDFDAPLPAETEPAAHAAHLLCPVVAAKPASHVSHAL